MLTGDRIADRIIVLLEASGVGRMDLIINRIRSDMVRRGDMMSVDDVMDILWEYCPLGVPVTVGP